jgi:hypothetical protein
MRKRILGYLSMTVLLVLVLAAPALSSSYFIYDQYGGTWHDANKTASPNDDLMCWAATASNILDWGHWGASGYNTETKIFQYLVDHWTNNVGYMGWAWKWWFNGSPPSNTNYAYPDVPGGKFYPSVNFNSYYSAPVFGDPMKLIDSLLHQGKGVGMVITGSQGGYSHAVTVWGFSTNASGTYTNIYITDSDDGVLGLRNYPLIWQNNAWYLGGGYSNWRIGIIQALGYDPNSSYTMSVLGQAPGEASNVPIAPSWVLFGTGVFSVFLMRRRQRPGKQDSSDL